MSDATGELADSFHFLALPQGFFYRPLLGDIAAYSVDAALIGHGSPGEKTVIAILGPIAVLECHRSPPDGQPRYFLDVASTSSG
ncbi:hypothetical protein ACFOHN_15210 [Novosphingobium panipatense]|uniref:hypothetical protein n=1 Tax=Novosphingobium panipatense TaxID=428991 RepID=UPI00361CC673